MAKRPIFDTSIFSDYTVRIEDLLLSCLFPSIIFYELVATSIDDSTLKKYERWRALASKNKLLVNPTASDWWATSKAIRRLYLMETEQPSKIKTLRNDALLARLAVMHDSFIVTHDIDDFQIIQKVMPNLKIMAAQEFFDY